MGEDNIQDKIVSAAMEVFGKNVYSKASVGDIAKLAKVSKSAIFYYFSNKKKLYLHLARLCGELIVGNLNLAEVTKNDDFFDRLKQISHIKMQVMRQYPFMMAFMKNMYLETDEAVKDDWRPLATTGLDTNKFVFDGVDMTKFKNGIDLKLMWQFLVWATEGAMSGLGHISTENFEPYIEDFFKFMDVLKQHFYKE